MKACMHCGKMVSDDDLFCPECGKPVSVVQTIQNRDEDQQQIQRQDYRNIRQQTKQRAGDFFEQVRGGIEQANAQMRDGDASMPMMVDGETLVRRYHCASSKFLFIKLQDGFLSVTNKRVIFHSKNRQSQLSTEIGIESVSGLDTMMGTNIKLPLLLIGIFIFDFGISLISFRSSFIDTSGLGFMLLIFGVVMVFLSIKRTFKMRIFSSKATGTPISIGLGAQSILGNSAITSQVGQPAEETQKMIYELGALISDLQLLGDQAITKWQQ